MKPTTLALASTLLLSTACGGSVNSIYRPFAPGLKYRDIGMGKKDGVRAGDPVLPGPYCSSLSSRAMRNSGLETFWGYTTTILAGALVATGAVWGATGDDEEGSDASDRRKRAVIAFPAAGAALLPLGTYLFARSSDNSTLAADAAAAAMKEDPGRECNTALAAWHRSRGPAVQALATNLQQKPSPKESTEDDASKVEARIAALEGMTGTTVSTTVRDQSLQEVKALDSRLSRLEEDASELETNAANALKAKLAALKQRLQDAERKLQQIKTEEVTTE